MPHSFEHKLIIYRQSQSLTLLHQAQLKCQEFSWGYNTCTSHTLVFCSISSPRMAHKHSAFVGVMSACDFFLFFFTSDDGRKQKTTLFTIFLC